MKCCKNNYKKSLKNERKLSNYEEALFLLEIVSAHDKNRNCLSLKY